LGEKLAYNSIEDFYDITEQLIKHHGGVALLNNLYEASLLQGLQDVYSDYKWLPWRIHQNSRDYWNKNEHQRLFLDWLGTKIGIQTYEDWYTITLNQIEDNGGRALIKRYGGSVCNILLSVYSEHHWITSKFILSNSWDNIDNRKHLLDTIGKKLGIESLDKWYQITSKQIEEMDGSYLLGKYGHSTSK
jgi:hypothetical protein